MPGITIFKISLSRDLEVGDRLSLRTRPTVKAVLVAPCHDRENYYCSLFTYIHKKAIVMSKTFITRRFLHLPDDTTTDRSHNFKKFAANTEIQG
jgi:hypothetical protein